MVRQNAAQILARFLWNPEVKKILKLEFTKDGKHEITTDSQLEFLSKFQDFLKHEEVGYESTAHAEVTDEEIALEARLDANRGQFMSNFPHDYQTHEEAFKVGAKWMRDKLKR